MLLLAQLVKNGAHETTRILRVGLHMRHDHLNVDILVGTASPAVVVCRHANHLVCNLGLARQLGLGQGRHVDDRAAPRAVKIGFCACGELWPFHANEQTRIVQTDALALQRVATAANNLGQARVKGIAEADVAHHAALEEGEGPDALCAVDDLVGHDEVAGLYFLLQRADGGEGDDGAHANAPQCSNVGAILDFMGGKLVVQAVAREEGNGDGLAGRGRGVVQDGDWRRRLAPRGVDIERCGEGEARKRLDARAANDGNVDRRCWLSARMRVEKQEEEVGERGGAHRRTQKRHQPSCGMEC